MDTSKKYLLMLDKAWKYIPEKYKEVAIFGSDLFCPKHLAVVLEPEFCSGLSGLSKPRKNQYCEPKNFKKILSTDDLNYILKFPFSNFTNLEKFYIFCKENRRSFQSNEQFLLAYYMSWQNRRWAPTAKSWISIAGGKKCLTT